MTWIDYLIFGLYMLGVLSIGAYHFCKNKDLEDYYVGSRSIKAHHVGLSGSWLLFTGLVGAWLSAVFMIPKIKRIDAHQKLMTYPDFLRTRYSGKVATLAALISGIGYLGFTGAQMLAGAKLASATILPKAPCHMDPILFALLVIAVVTILYTVIGGLKAVIYTDTIQWLLLLFVPTLGAYFWEKGTSTGAMAGMIGGGLLTILLLTKTLALPHALAVWGFDASLYGITLSAILYISISLLFPEKTRSQEV